MSKNSNPNQNTPSASNSSKTSTQTQPLVLKKAIPSTSEDINPIFISGLIQDKSLNKKPLPEKTPQSAKDTNFIEIDLKSDTQLDFKPLKIGEIKETNPQESIRIAFNVWTGTAPNTPLCTKCSFEYGTIVLTFNDLQNAKGALARLKSILPGDGVTLLEYGNKNNCDIVISETHLVKFLKELGWDQAREGLGFRGSMRGLGKSMSKLLSSSKENLSETPKGELPGFGKVIRDINMVQRKQFLGQPFGVAQPNEEPKENEVSSQTSEFVFNHTSPCNIEKVPAMSVSTLWAATDICLDNVNKNKISSLIPCINNSALESLSNSSAKGAYNPSTESVFTARGAMAMLSNAGFTKDEINQIIPVGLAIAKLEASAKKADKKGVDDSLLALYTTLGKDQFTLVLSQIRDDAKTYPSASKYLNGSSAQPSSWLTSTISKGSISNLLSPISSPSKSSEKLIEKTNDAFTYQALMVLQGRDQETLKTLYASTLLQRLGINTGDSLGVSSNIAPFFPLVTLLLGDSTSTMLNSKVFGQEQVSDIRNRLINDLNEVVKGYNHNKNTSFHALNPKNASIFEKAAYTSKDNETILAFLQDETVTKLLKQYEQELTHVFLAEALVEEVRNPSAEKKSNLFINRLNYLTNPQKSETGSDTEMMLTVIKTNAQIPVNRDALEKAVRDIETGTPLSPEEMILLGQTPPVTSKPADPRLSTISTTSNWDLLSSTGSQDSTRGRSDTQNILLNEDQPRDRSFTEQLQEIVNLIPTEQKKTDTPVTQSPASSNNSSISSSSSSSSFAESVENSPKKEFKKRNSYSSSEEDTKEKKDKNPKWEK